MRLALDSASLFPRLFAEARPLSESIEHLAGQEVPKYKWIHVASEGLYRGHWQGAFNLTREVFQSFVDNLHQHPQYKAGARTFGEAERACGVRDVVQFDYEHASEMHAAEGSIPSQGAPAPAWVQDLEVRSGADGRAQLWALANLGEQIRGQIQRNEYRFVSIAFDLEHSHWVSGENQGPTLTSIAFTNHPFLTNLESYAAANRRPGQPQADRVQPWASGNEAPVDTPERVSTMTVTAPQTTAAAADFERFRSRICSALGLRITLADDAVVESAGEAAKAGSSLNSLLESLGVKDASNAIKVVPELMGARSKLVELTQELDQLLAGNAAQEAAMAAGDVAAVMSAKGWKDESLKGPVAADRSQRLNDAEAQLLKANPKATIAQRISCRSEARQAYLKEMGAQPAEGGVDPVTLTTPIAATRGGVQLSTPSTLPAGTGSRVLPADGVSDTSTGEIIDLRNTAGANPFEKVIRHLSSKDPAFEKLPHFQRCKRAADFQRSNQFLY